MFLLSLATLVVFIVMSVVDHNAAVTKTRLLLNPRDIDVRFEGGNSCNNWVSQESYAIGLGGLITDLLNTYSTLWCTIKPITGSMSQAAPVRR